MYFLSAWHGSPLLLLFSVCFCFSECKSGICLHVSCKRQLTINNFNSYSSYFPAMWQCHKSTDSYVVCLLNIFPSRQCECVWSQVANLYVGRFLLRGSSCSNSPFCYLPPPALNQCPELTSGVSKHKLVGFSFSFPYYFLYTVFRLCRSAHMYWTLDFVHTMSTNL